MKSLLRFEVLDIPYLSVCLGAFLVALFLFAGFFFVCFWEFLDMFAYVSRWPYVFFFGGGSVTPSLFRCIDFVLICFLSIALVGFRVSWGGLVMYLCSC